MKKEKAFTLVELLAVIVILAIILIIAVPGVLSIINKTKGNALDRQKDMIKEASRLYITSDTDVTWVGQDTKMTTVSLDVLKTKGYLDQKILDPKTKQEITCAKTTITKTGSKYDYDVQFCDQVNRSPRLSSNMIPIVYDGSKWIKADYTNQDNAWYDYENQQWANMATVTEATRENYKKANIGTEVKMDDINTMFVWIPRFKYKLFNVDGTISPVGNPNMAGDYMIDVQLEDGNETKSKGSQNGEWLTHPTFTFGGQELSGFWVGKFETGYNQGNDLSTYTTAGAEQDITDPSKVLIKPGIHSWRKLQVYNMYKNARGIGEEANVFGFTAGEDTHMIKNMEWGAMAYLTSSKYGKTGNVDYTGIEHQVRLNNNQDFMTGCGADSQDAEASSSCNSYETANGISASTTGNITGIYDTAGGAWDYVAGFTKMKSGTDLSVSLSGFPQNELNTLGTEVKYIDVYGYGTTWTDRSQGHLGDATLEMGPFNNDRNAWYDDYGIFFQEASSLLVRGGRITYPTGSGITSFHREYGGAGVGYGSRIIIV